MTLHNAPPPLVHDLKVGEDLHGMVMLMAGVPVPGQFGNSRSEVSRTRIGDGRGEPGNRSQLLKTVPSHLSNLLVCVCQYGFVVRSRYACLATQFSSMAHCKRKRGLSSKYAEVISW